MDPTESTMDVEEIKTEKNETKLPFSIENLLADKFEKQNCNDFTASDANASTSGVNCGLKNNFISDVTENNDSDDDDDVDDRASNSSENVDVESSTVGDAQEYLDIKSADYGQSGNILNA